MNEQHPDEHSDESCPKRLWVMLALSDDEQVDESGALPLGLQTHLAHCESCRALAERLMSVTRALGEMGVLEPAAGLGPQAEAQALAAIKDGARLSGRVDVPEDEEPVSTTARPDFRRHLVRYAAAAVIVMAAAIFWALSPDSLEEPPDGRSEPFPPLMTDARPEPAEPTPAPVPASDEPEMEESGPEGRLAESTPDQESPRPQRTVCQHHSHVEAALSDDDTCILRAVILPDPTERNLGWGGVFDRESPVESTTLLLEEE